MVNRSGDRFGRGGSTVLRRLWREIDLHVVAMLLVFIPALCLSPWWLVVPLLVPQGRIYVRAFRDYRAFRRRPWAYLVANELLVIGMVGAGAGVRLAA
jgi:hypothetical protein